MMKERQTTHSVPPELPALRRRISELDAEVHILRQIDDTLCRAGEELIKCEAKNRALLESSKAILEHRDFATCARRIFDICSQVIGAPSGYIALMSKDGSQNEVLFLESGGLPCAVDPSLPMPIRGLRAEAYRLCRPVWDNDFWKSGWSEFIPAGHVVLENVLFAPLVLDGTSVGVLGLANKPGGFTDSDAALATAFAEFAAIGLQNSRVLQLLEEGEERYRTVADFTYNWEYWMSRDDSLLYVSPSCERLTGYSREEFMSDVGLMDRIVHPEDTDTWLKHVEYSRTNAELGKCDLEFRIVHRNGDVRWMGHTCQPVHGPGGQPRSRRCSNRDVTHRRIEQERQKQLTQEMRDFTYLVSHDLRAPLVNLKGFSSELQLAIDEIQPVLNGALAQLPEAERGLIITALQEEVPQCLGFMNAAVSRMDKLVDAVLQLSRLGRQSLRIDCIDMDELARHVLDSLRHELNRKGVAVSVAALPETIADRTCMEQIMGNLIDNAIKFLDPERPGILAITGERFDDETFFRVRDNGRGIDPKDLDRVFEMFRRSGNKDVPGEGMGLACVRTLVRRHDGRIWSESEPGVGTTFTFTISNRLQEERQNF